MGRVVTGARNYRLVIHLESVGKTTEIVSIIEPLQFRQEVNKRQIGFGQDCS